MAKIKSFFILNFGQSKYTSQLKNISLLIQKEDFQTAQNEIEKLEREINLNKKNRIKTQFLKSRIMIGLSDATKGLEIANDLLETSKKLDYSLFTENLIIKGILLFELGKFDESLNTLTEGEKILENIPDHKQKSLRASIDLVKGRCYQRKRDSDHALEYLNRSLLYSTDLDEIATANNGIGIIYASKGEFDNALKYFQQSLEANEKIGRIQTSLRLLNNIGLVYSYKGDQDLALEYYRRALKISEELHNKQLSATLTYNIGLIYLNRGELDLSLEYSQRSLKVYEELECENERAQCLNVIGNVHHQKGNLEQSLEYYNNSLKIFQKLGSKSDTATSFNNLANTYTLQGNVEEAISYYKQSLELLEDIGNSYDISVTLQNIIQLYTSHGEVEESTPYLERLKEISEKEKDNKTITQAYKLAQALQLKQSDRVIKRAEAQKLLQEIAEEEIVYHEWTVSALMNLCDVLLQELRTSGDEEVLNEIKNIINRLLTIAESQQMPRLHTNVYRLQSKMALLELDLNQAQKLLDQAQQIATKQGLKNVAIAISGEYDSLLVQLGKWTDLLDQNVSIIERLDLTELEGMVSQIIKQ
ncbi:tetratricopeptide repeat protein, partial [Candidatus Hodarchaeum mangrovi]